MSKKLLIGAHTSAAGGSYNALLEGQKIGATTIQLFTSNQKQWKGRKIEKEEVELWQKALKETGIEQVMSHDSYLINLGSTSKDSLEQSRRAFREEIERCHLLGIPLLNFHPGAATTSTAEACLETIVESLNSVESLVHGGPTRLVLETTAGQGTSVGHKFEQLGFILQNVSKKVPMGVCIDTCHIFSAGYDIRTALGWEKVLQEFDDAIGLKHLYAFHINDSMKEFNSRKDRHASLGKGTIGLEAFKFLVNHPKTKHLPMYLETPDETIWKDELNLLRNLAGELS
jgi:deoxyribonuclease IV